MDGGASDHPKDHGPSDRKKQYMLYTDKKKQYMLYTDREKQYILYTDSFGNKTIAQPKPAKSNNNVK